jgi:hypothetical protein
LKQISAFLSNSVRDLDEGRRTLGTELAQLLKDFSILNCEKILASFPLIVAGSSLLKIGKIT